MFQLCPVFCILSLLLKFLFSTSQFIVVINVAALAFAFRVCKSLTSMRALGRDVFSTILVIAVVTHAHSVDRKVVMRTVCYFTLLSSGLARLHSTWFWTGVRL